MAIRARSSLFAFVLVVAVCVSGLDAHAETVTAASCTYPDVSAAVASASSGDTVMVPAGIATWGTTLSVGSAITLQGAGVGKTIITGNIAYTMPTPALPTLFRLTGFSLAGRVTLNNLTRYFAGRVRVDHNVVSSTGSPLSVNGNVYGVIDNNTIDMGGPLMMLGANSNSWGYVTFAYGTEATLFLEDNDINFASATSSLFQDSGAGTMFVVRYNNFTFSCTNTSNVYWWDMHGNQNSTSNHSTMGAEIFGNRLVSTTARNLQIIDQRGGSLVIFWNKAQIEGSAWYQTREECDDCLNGHVPCTGPSGQPMRVSNSYYWNNRYRENLITVHNISNAVWGGTGGCVETANPIVLGVDVFNDNGHGVKCGPLSSLPSTCTVGEAYWATDHDCARIEDSSVGKYPTTPVSGTLYKCTAPNKWTAYYTPFVYPHPLREEASAPSFPVAPSGLRIAP